MAFSVSAISGKKRFGDRTKYVGGAILPSSPQARRTGAQHIRQPTHVRDQGSHKGAPLGRGDAQPGVRPVSVQDAIGGLYKGSEGQQGRDRYRHCRTFRCEPSNDLGLGEEERLPCTYPLFPANEPLVLVGR